MFWEIHQSFYGATYLFWTSGDVCPGLQNQGRFSHLHASWTQWISQMHLWCDTCWHLATHLSTFIYLLESRIFTVRNEVIFFTRVCDSVHGGGVLSHHALQVVSQHALQQGDLLRGAAWFGGCLLREGCVETPLPKADGYCCGRVRILLECILVEISFLTEQNYEASVKSLLVLGVFNSKSAANDSWYLSLEFTIHKINIARAKCSVSCRKDLSLKISEWFQ